MAACTPTGAATPTSRHRSTATPNGQTTTPTGQSSQTATPTSASTTTPTGHTPASHKATATPTGRATTPTRPGASDLKIPCVWSTPTQRCLNEKRVTPEVRKELTYTLSVMLAASTSGMPTPLQCERVANAIVAKYPFLADPFGASQAVSSNIY